MQEVQLHLVVVVLVVDLEPLVVDQQESYQVLMVEMLLKDL